MHDVKDDRCLVASTHDMLHPPCLLMKGHMGPHNWERPPAPPLCRVCNCVPCTCFPVIAACTPVLERIAIELEIANLYRAVDRSHSKEDEQALKAAIGRRVQLSGPIPGRRT